MATAPLFYAALTLVIALFGGLLPVLSSIKQNPERLKVLTGLAAGIIIGLDTDTPETTEAILEFIEVSQIPRKRREMRKMSG